MKADKTACAATNEKVVWHAIDWHKVHRNVRRQQVRIVKAVQVGRWGKVKALQRLLTRSFSGRALAVKRVTENQGRRTPGVDGKIWDTPTKKARAVANLSAKGYRPHPLRRIYIPKSDGRSQRPLSIPTMYDRAMQALYLLALEPIAETTADPHSYSFRKERSTADAIQQCFILLGRKTSPEWLLEGDIRACFDQNSHPWLLTHIPIERKILKKWLAAGYMEKGSYHAITEGVPQGGIISPVLMNITLDGLQKHLAETFPYKNGKSQMVNLVRFADDFIVTGRTKELLEQEVLPTIMAFLKPRGLELSPHKTHVTHISQGFDFLGQNVRKYEGKLIIKPAKENVQAFLTKIRQTIKANKATSPGKLIKQLNPIIRGWANYHQHVCSSETFKRVDSAIFRTLWWWAKRRHNNKGKRWVRQKYFHTIGKRRWVFTGIIRGKKGEFHPIHLCAAAKTRIRRHVKIHRYTNPFDPQWEVYLERRQSIHMAHTLRNQRRLKNLWKSQHGKCLLCYQAITEQTGWHVHHIVWLSKGGSNKMANLALLHPTCHHQVHSQKLSVILLRLEKGVLVA